MTHNFRHRQIQRIKKKYKNLAAIVAAATILSTTSMLPGATTGIAHASSSSNANNMSASISQQVARTNDSASQINFNSSVQPTAKAKQVIATEVPNTNINQTPFIISQPNKVVAKPATPQQNPVDNKPVVTPPQVAPEVELPATPEPNPDDIKPPITPPQPAPEVELPATPEPNPDDVKPPVTPPQVAPEVKQPATPEPNPDDVAKTSPATNAPTDYKQVLDVKATAYAPGPHDNEQWGNKTFIGTEVRPGIIAVDPKVIPLGSRVYIQYPDGHGEYAVAEDTGGAIKGNRVDIAKWTVNEAEDFGIQNVKVFVISSPKKA